MRCLSKQKKMVGGSTRKETRRFARLISAWIVGIITGTLGVLGCQGEQARFTAPMEPSLMVTSASLSSLTVVLLPSSIFVGNRAQACAYYRFNNGKVGMRSQDALRCSTDFVRRYTYWQRSITRARQDFLNRACISWKTSETEATTCPPATVGSFILAMGDPDATSP